MMRRYLLIDGARYPDALARLYGRNEVLEVEPLYFDTPWHGAADLGPLLVSADPASGLFLEFETDLALHSSAAELSSHLSLNAVAIHLRRFNHVSDVTGGETLLRYADPLVAWFWLHSYHADTLRAVMGPITRWRIAAPSSALLPQQPSRWHDFSPAPRATENALPVLPLGHPQLSALQQAYQHQLKERLYRWLQKNRKTALAAIPKHALDAWFDARLADAEAFGLSTERSIAVWCDLSLRDGSDFAVAPQGAFQRGLAQVKQQPPQTPDQQLQHYYRNCVCAIARNAENHDHPA
ncbi:DUF4123 domain-containing protein [Halopseudomonas oceani]|uniref:DUF4123 domain-containing protein n=1 Tax=Halopseudomonas oceani TaxID=1708783 RepID=UPI002AA82103|nr:DUF4123 domain-containing protein [Halopseudomonas oceani]